MDLEILKIAANLGLAAVVAVLLLLWKRQDDRRFEAVISGFLKRQEEMVQALIRVVEANNRALADIHVALGQIRAFMESVDVRLARVENALQEVRRGSRQTFR